MRQLTQKEAEQFARAYGWKIADINKCRPKNKQIITLISAKEIIHDINSIPLNPHFWRPRLEDRLIEVAKENHIAKIYTQLSLDYGGGNSQIALFRIFADDNELASGSEILGDNYCSIYCEAIEKLTAVQIESKSGQEKEE